ncbi:GNAT family N-acetyltransferase [Chelatococcus reniformis]|uniref:N-acetyltransferase n=1 Tax=Chelatococcus reniformis TaxID=1494448 RepID=A0A916XBG7_9HYPH|nr:GNAT family N-acetyltransferase [Chelatococcus reniformis]GGC59573.1 N-acetyltransferase [Chelatococcus reniformis]
MDEEQPVVVRPSRDGDVEAMLAIYRRHIRRGVEDGVDDSGTPEPDDLRNRRKNLRNRRFPHLVATRGDRVVGYAYVVLFRKRPAYRFTVKHSIYVHHEEIGRGVGRHLMQALIDACAATGFRQMIGYIDADNTASLALHDKFGFDRVGLLRGVGYKYGRWADSVMVQRSLAAGTTTPPPAEGLGVR